MMKSCLVTLKDEIETAALGASLARLCVGRAMIYLYGNLGAGKTTLCRGFLRELGYKGSVKSPTYTLVEPYQSANRFVYHFDFYRILHPEELEFMGIRDYFAEDAVFLVEWPQKGKEMLPDPDISIRLHARGLSREAELTALSFQGEQILSGL